MKNINSILLIIGIIIAVNVLSKHFFYRFDLTQDKQFTLSDATRDILQNLEDPVMIKAYFSGGLDVQLEKNKADFTDMLVEYANLSKGMVDYEFIDPMESPETEQAAMQNGIQPVLVNVRKEDQFTQAKVFMGAVMELGQAKEIIPIIQPGQAMEYDLTTNIKKMAVKDKPTIGLVQGHGEPGLSDLSQVYQGLSILYNVENVDLNTPTIDPKFKTIAIVAPKDSFPPNQFNTLDEYLSRGGNLFIAMDAVNGDLQNAQGVALTTGLEGWLKGKGLEIKPEFLIDANCGNVSVQQRQGFFNFNTPISFPFLPIIKTFKEHLVTKGLEQVMLPFSSPIKYTGQGATYESLLNASIKSGRVSTPTTFDVANKKWGSADFTEPSLSAGGVLEGTLVPGGQPAKMIVIGDGDFPVSGAQGRGQSQDNISLMVNSIDWLSDDTGLIALRTKGVASRPIDDLEDGTRSMLKYLNFFLPLLMVVLYGLFRMQRKRTTRRIREAQNFA